MGGRGGWSPKGKNAIRQLFSQSATIVEELKDVRGGLLQPTLFRAVVSDVIFDPMCMATSTMTALQALVRNSAVFTNMPRNSIIARLVSNGEDKRNNTPFVFFPFFPPHLSMPIKPGEHVWVIFDNAAASLQFGYWMSRVTDPFSVDDINFTHSDRRLRNPAVIPISPKETAKTSGETFEGQPLEPPPGPTDPISHTPGEQFDDPATGNPGFPNGDCTLSGRTLVAKSDYEKIYLGSWANRVINYEPVPRYSKRPGDLVLQGSNNALICLGEDRTGTVAVLDAQGNPEKPSIAESQTSDLRGFAGTIDIVAGRSRGLDSVTATDPDAKRSSTTLPPTVENTRSLQEVAKNPSLRKVPATNNILEGDPQFALDSSRIYVSMRTNGDKNFAIPYPKGSDNAKNGNSFYGTGDIVKPIPEDESGAAYVVMKSDEIRIVARKKEISQQAATEAAMQADLLPDINGSIKIIKEGTEGDDLAAIIMHPDGTIQIDSPKIILGRNDAKTTSSASGATGYVKYSEYRNQMEKLHDEISTFADTIHQKMDAISTKFNTVTDDTYVPSSGTGVQVTGTFTSGGAPAKVKESKSDFEDAGTAAETLKTNVDDLKSKIPEARSDTIFGE